MLHKAINKIQKGHLGETVPFLPETKSERWAQLSMKCQSSSHESQGEIKNAEKKYRSIFENATVGIYQSTADEKGRFLTVNPAFAHIMGYASPEEVSRI